ncbi:DUF1439 domain-containing protein [Ursidibacter sp. B-7004-1]
MKKLGKSALLLLSLSATVANAGLLSITQQEINQYLDTRLAEKIPLKDSIGIPNLFELDYHLHNLATQIGQTPEKRVEIGGIVDGLLRLKGKSYDIKAHLNLDTVPFYDQTKGAIFLKDVRLKNWYITPEKYQNELQTFLPALESGLADVLEHYPVYTLDENKTKEAIFKKIGKSIVIEKGVLQLETSIF